MLNKIFSPKPRNLAMAQIAGSKYAKTVVGAARKTMHLFCMAGFVFFVTNGNAQTQKPVVKPGSYYLDSAGNDNNAGTRISPWKTIQKINKTRLKAGDSVLLMAGQLFKGSLQLLAGSQGQPYHPIIITSYGKGKALIDAGNEAGIRIEKTTFITVKNLQLVGAGRKDGNTEDGVSVTNCSNINLNDLNIAGFRKAGVFIHSSSYIRVINVDAHDNGFAGISVSGEYQQKKSCSNIYIGYCKANNNPGSPVMLNNHSGNGIVAGFCSGLIIEYCTATGNGWDMPRVGNGPVGIWCYETDSAIIQHCISYRNQTSKGGDDGGGFDLDGGVTNSIIQYCLSYENQGSGYGIFQYAGASAWHHNIIRYNISENDGSVSAAKAGIYIWNSSDDAQQFHDCMFYNNSIYNSKNAAISFAGQSQRNGFLFYNNIFIGGDSLLSGKRMDDVFLANNWWSLHNPLTIEGSAGLEEWAKKSGQEMKDGKIFGLNTDPHFRKAGSSTITSALRLSLFNGYQVPPGSVLRQAGLDLHTVFKMDTGGIDLNGQPAPPKGIGACF